MHEQIRIPPNRGREMRIMRQRQSEMSKIFRAVIRGGLRAKNASMNQRRMRRVFRFLEHFIKMLRLNPIPLADGKAKLLEKILQITDTIRGRRLMHAKHGRNIFL